MGGGGNCQLFAGGFCLFYARHMRFGHGRSLSTGPKTHFSCAVLLNGEYGIKDLCGGVPVIIGGTGVERVIELSLTSKEMDLFQASVEGVRKVIDTLQPTE